MFAAFGLIFSLRSRNRQLGLSRLFSVFSLSRRLFVAFGFFFDLRSQNRQLGLSRLFSVFSLDRRIFTAFGLIFDLRSQNRQFQHERLELSDPLGRLPAARTVFHGSLRTLPRRRLGAAKRVKLGHARLLCFIYRIGRLLPALIIIFSPLLNALSTLLLRIFGLFFGFSRLPADLVRSLCTAHRFFGILLLCRRIFDVFLLRIGFVLTVLFAVYRPVAERDLRIVIVQNDPARFRKLQYRKERRHTFALGLHAVVNVRKVAHSAGVQLFEDINYLCPQRDYLMRNKRLEYLRINGLFISCLLRKPQIRL